MNPGGNFIKTPTTKVKLLMLGDSGVGKSSILNRFVEEKFSPNFFTTLGVEYKQKILDVNGQKVQLQIWDTAGQERFKTITPVYYKSVDGVVLVYDILDLQTFENVEYWLQDLSDHADRSKISIVLAANKVDIPNRLIEKKQGEEAAQKGGMNYYECSAKSNLNVNQLFQDITNQIIQKRGLIKFELDQDIVDGLILVSPDKNSSSKTNNAQEQNKGKGCCDK